MADIAQNNTAQPSWVYIPEAAADAARKMLDPECPETYVALERQFTQAMSDFEKEYYLDIDFDAGNLPWSCSGLSVKDYFIVSDENDNIVAFIGKEDCLHEKEIHSLMQNAGISPTKSNIQKICSSLLGFIPKGTTLRDVFQTGIDAAIASSQKHAMEALADQIHSAATAKCISTVTQATIRDIEPER